MMRCGFPYTLYIYTISLILQMPRDVPSMVQWKLCTGGHEMHQDACSVSSGSLVLSKVWFSASMFASLVLVHVEFLIVRPATVWVWALVGFVIADAWPAVQSSRGHKTGLYHHSLMYCILWPRNRNGTCSGGIEHCMVAVVVTKGELRLPAASFSIYFSVCVISFFTTVHWPSQPKTGNEGTSQVCNCSHFITGKPLF